MNEECNPPESSHDSFKRCWYQTAATLTAAGIVPDPVRLTEYCTLHAGIAGALKTMLNDNLTNHHVFERAATLWQNQICEVCCLLTKCNKAVCKKLCADGEHLLNSELLSVFNGGVQWEQ